MKKLLILLLFFPAVLLAQPNTVAVGTSANDGTGDPLRTAMQKLNANDGAIYDTISDHRGELNDLVDTAGVHITRILALEAADLSDSITDHRTELNDLTDSIADHRIEIDDLTDTAAAHLTRIADLELHSYTKAVDYTTCPYNDTTDIVIGSSLTDLSFMIHYTSYQDISSVEYHQSGTIEVQYNPSLQTVNYSSSYMGSDIGMTIEADKNNLELRLNIIIADDPILMNNRFFDYKIISKFTQ